MHFGRIVFYAFLAYVAYMLIGHIVQVLHQPPQEQPHEQQEPPPVDPRVQEMDAHMRDGLVAFRKGESKPAEAHFLAGRALAKELHIQDYLNHFTIMLGNLYLEGNKLEQAEALLKEAATQDNLDEISYNNQLVILYEKQGKHKGMCNALAVLEKKLASLNCAPYLEDIKILEAQEDDGKIVEIFKKPDIEVIVDCAGRRMIEKKIEEKRCN